MSIVPNCPELLTEEQRAQLKRQQENQARQKRERSLVRGLIRALKVHGFRATMVNDGEEMVKTSTEAQALDAVFSVDEATLVFQREKGGKRYGVFLVCGEDRDIIADHHDLPEFTPIIDQYMRDAGLI